MVALDAGVPLRDVQEAASHAGPRTTMRYDRGRQSLDRHATYIVATFVGFAHSADTRLTFGAKGAPVALSVGPSSSGACRNAATPAPS